MSETLWAVIIGGLIGIVATIPALVINERRWKKDKKLEYLKTERSRRKEQYKYLASKLPEAIEKNISNNEVVAEFWIDVPEKIRNKIMSCIVEIQKNIQEHKKVDTSDLTFQMTTLMEESLEEIDKEINKLLS